jgi:hypothetical protein
MEQLLREESIDITDASELMAPTENADAIDPTDANDPMLPTDSTDPLEQMDKNELWERQESMSSPLPAGKLNRLTVGLCCQHLVHGGDRAGSFADG